MPTPLRSLEQIVREQFGVMLMEMCALRAELEALKAEKSAPPPKESD